MVYVKSQLLWYNVIIPLWVYSCMIDIHCEWLLIVSLLNKSIPDPWIWTHIVIDGWWDTWMLVDLYCFNYISQWWRFGGSFSKVVATFNHVSRSFNLFKFHHQGYLNNPISSNLGSYDACWACFMCHHELWPTSVSHPFAFLGSSWGPTGGNQYQNITSPILRQVLQNFALMGCFPYIEFYYFSLLSSGWVFIAVCGSISVQGAS